MPSLRRRLGLATTLCALASNLFSVSSMEDVEMKVNLATSPTYQPSCSSNSVEVVKAESADYGIFGSLNHLEYGTGTASFLIIMAGVIFIETSFHYIGHKVKETAYEEIMVGIQKELMVVGTVAFIFKIVLSFVVIQADWLHALEYADILIPFTSFCFCIEGLLLAIRCSKQCRIWSKAYNLKLVELLDEFYQLTKAQQHSLTKYAHISTYIPWVKSDIITLLEFRVFHTIFSDVYKIQKSALEFNEYVNNMYVRYLHDIIHISFRDWFILGLLVVLNAWRAFAHGEVVECEGYESAGHRRLRLLSSQADDDDHSSSSSEMTLEECKALAALELFVIMGFIMLLLTIVTTAVSRYYEVKIFQVCGVNSGEDYISFLQKAEEVEGKADSAVKTGSKFDASGLKDIIKKAKKKNAHKGHPQGHWYQATLSKAWRFINSRNDTRKSVFDLEEDEHTIFDEETAGANLETTLTPPQFDKRKYNVMSYLKNKQKIPKSAVESQKIAPGVDENFLETSEYSAKEGGEADDDEFEAQALPTKLKNIFLFGRPDFYFYFVEVLMTIQAFFSALVVTNFIISAVNDLHSAGWVLALVLPNLLSSILFLYIVQSTIMLKIIIYIDYDCLDETMEDTENAIELGNIMREKMLSRLVLMGDPEVELLTLFEAIDKDLNTYLSRDELKAFLHEIRVSFSRKRWHQIFRHIDKNFDNQVSFDELFIFLFPKHDVALAQEQKRLKALGRIVSIHQEGENSSEVMRTSVFTRKCATTATTENSLAAFAQMNSLNSVEHPEKAHEGGEK